MSNEQIQEMIKEAEKMQGFIGGFLYEKLTIVHGRTILFLDVSLHASPLRT